MFLDLCLKTKKISRLQELFNLFLTLEEKEHLASLMQIIKALLDEKLSRGSNALKIVNDDLLKFIENYVRKYKKNEQ